MEFRITFGVKYDYETHPFLPDVTSKHYVTVIADDPKQARQITLNMIGRYFAADYQEPPAGWAGHWTSTNNYRELTRWDKSTSDGHIKKVIEVTINETVVRSRRFTKAEIMRLLDIEAWEYDRTDPVRMAEMFQDSESGMAELDGYDDSATVTADIVRSKDPVVSRKDAT